MLRRINVLIVVALWVLASVVEPAGAATVIPVTPTQQLSVRVPANSLPVYTSAQVYLETCTDQRIGQLGTTNTDGEGGARFTLTVPAGTEPGCYQARFVRGTASAVSARFLVRNPQVVRAGQTISVSVPGDGRFDERPLLEVILETCSDVRVRRLGHVVTSEDGSATFTFVVPHGTDPGCYHVRFISAVTSAFTLIRVRAVRAPALTPRPVATLPTTGLPVLAVGVAGGMLMAVGLVGVGLGRRRTA